MGVRVFKFVGPDFSLDASVLGSLGVSFFADEDRGIQRLGEVLAEGRGGFKHVYKRAHQSIRRSSNY